MKIKAYFFFPETDDDFIRIGEDPQTYKKLIEEVDIIKQQLKAHRDFELCYDSANVELFLAKAESLIDGVYLADCRKQLKILFGPYSRNVSNTFQRKTDCIYMNWNINCAVNYANQIFSEASEAKLHEGTDKTILINIANAYTTTREYVHIIKDAIHYNELPLMITIPVANNEIEFSEWHLEFTTPGFSLKDRNIFHLTSFRWIKQSIYVETATGNYWYYDYFHRENKKHYEVFNQEGIHLGEANINGVLDLRKAKEKKRIDKIIQ